MPSPKSETLETRELMTDQQLKFAEGFPMPTYEQWVAEVEKALKGAPSISACTPRPTKA